MAESKFWNHKVADKILAAFPADYVKSLQIQGGFTLQ